MELEKLQELLSSAAANYEAVVKAISVKGKPKTEEPLKEYDVAQHLVFDKTERPDQERKNAAGEALTPRKVNRIGLAFEQLIVTRAAAFLCANPIIYKCSPEGPVQEKMWAAFKRINENAKLDYKNQSILEKRMSETEIAEIWFLEELSEDDDYWSGIETSAKQKPRLFLAAASLKDKLYPVWDKFENLIAIAREYIAVDENEKEITHFDLYTAEKIYEGIKGATGWEVNEIPNDILKVPSVYHTQEDVEWAVVRSICRRLENLYSNFAESNDKTAFPMLVLEGDVADLPQGIADKAMKMKNGGKAHYVVPPNAPDAVKLEIESLWRALFILTDTVDISPDSLQGVGQTSGVALELLFMPAHLKASKHAGTFGECLQRRINLIKKMLVVIDPSLKEAIGLNIKPTFDFFLPKDLAAIINYLVSATSGEKPLLSQETAVYILQGAMGGDAKTEWDRIKAEANSPEALDREQNKD